MDQYMRQVDTDTEAIVKVPAEVAEHLQNNREKNIEDLKKVQEQYASELTRMNDEAFKQIQSVFKNLHEYAESFKMNSTQEYDAFLQELKGILTAHTNQLLDTEHQVVSLSQQLESKYNAFVTKLESTNVDQLYKYCQEMNKSINTKLGIVLGGVAVAIIVSAISLFI